MGYNGSTATVSISGSSASGAVLAQNGACSNACATSGNIGGLIGHNGNTTYTSISGNFATGNVTIGLSGGNEYIGGLVGTNTSTSTTSIINSYYATGTLSYTGTSPTNLYIGGLVGYNQSGTIGGTGSSYSYATVPVSYTGNAVGNIGGLVGQNAGTINQAYATGSVSYTGTGTGSNIGGLTGYNSGTISNDYTQTGTVTGTSNASGAVADTLYIGGLVGGNYSGGTITSSTASEAVAYVYAGSSTATNTADIGGLVGYNTSTATASVSGSWASGNVTANSTGCTGNCHATALIGGLIGLNGNSSATAINTSYATGSVTNALSNGGSGGEDAGGLVGQNYTTGTGITDSYATGTVIYSGTETATYIGGLAGWNQSGTIYHTYAIGDVIPGVATSHGGLVGVNAGTVSNSYWDTGTTNQGATLTGGTVTSSSGVNTMTLQAALPSGWSSSTWGIIAGSSYPYLLYQYPSGTPQEISGIAYSDRGVTILAGAAISGLINGATLTSLGGAVTSGANGYYSFLLAANTISAAGSEILLYYTGSTKGNVLDDGATGSVTGLNIYGNALRIVTVTGTPTSITNGLITAQGSNTGSNFLATASSANGINIITTSAGDIDLASNLSWSNNSSLVLSAYRNVYIDSTVTITNNNTTAFTGTATGNTVPVLLALRADNTGTDAGYGVTSTSSTINFTGSNGAVSIFNDSTFATANGTQNGNSSWSTLAPANQSVSTQFTTYKLINSVADLIAVNTNATTLGYTYALGAPITGTGGAFNSNAALGTFTGVLDGQYGALLGGTDYAISNYTLTTTANTGALFSTNNGIIRNLGIGLTVSVTDNSVATNTGTTLAATNGGTVANVSALSSGSVTVNDTEAGSAMSVGIGGLVGTNSGTGTIINSSAADNVTFNVNSTNPNNGFVSIGGLVGIDTSTATLSISNSTASGTVKTALTGNSSPNSTYIGGLVGQDNGGTEANNSASGMVTGGTASNGSIDVGGLVGYIAAGTVEGTGSAYAFATGPVSYTGPTSASNIGGLVGYNAGTVTQAYATGNVSYSGALGSTLGGLVGSNAAAGTISNSTTNTGTVTGTSTVSGSAANTLTLGGLVGTNSGTINTNSGSSENVTYTYAGTSTGTSGANIGGLVGYNPSTVTTSIANSSASGTVTAGYSQTGCSTYACTGIVNGYIGGLIGFNGSTTATATATSTNTATGNVTSSLSGGTEDVGGLVGYSNSTLSTAIINSNYTMGTVSYTGTTAYVGGLVGSNNSGTIGGTGSLYSYAAATINFTPVLSYTSTTYTYNIGGLVGSNSGTINQTYANTAISATNNAAGSSSNTINLGGLAGAGGGTITNSTSSANVTYTYAGTSSGTSTANVGGLIGYNTSAPTGDSASGTVTAGYSQTACSGVCAGAVIGNIGGLVGEHYSGTITNSSATGSVTSSLTGTESIGGLVGYDNAPIQGTGSSFSFATGNVNYTGNNGGISVYIGGLVGQIASGSVTQSYSSLGTVTDTTLVSGSGVATDEVGGLVGYNTGGNITNSYSNENVNYVYQGTTSATTNTLYIGGLVGFHNGGTTSGSFSSGIVTAGYAATYSGTIGTSGIGGLEGYGNGSSTVTNDYSTSPIYSTITNNPRVGGLLGASVGTVSYSYDTGYISALGTGVNAALTGGTVTNVYWDSSTTGTSTSAKGTIETTTALQAGLLTGFSNATWGIIAGVSYPYLLWQYPTTPQVVSGTTYSNHGVTVAPAASVSILINGSVPSLAQGSSVISGNSGYYYYILPAGTIAAGGTSVLTYFTGTTKGDTFNDAATGNLTSNNIYGNYLVINSGAASLSAMATDLTTAMGTNTGANFPYTIGTGTFATSTGTSLQINATGSTVAIDDTLTLPASATLIVNGTGTFTQSQAITAPNMLLQGTGATYTFTNASNTIGTLAASVGTGTVNVNDGANTLAIGTVNSINGITAGEFDLTDTGTVTQSQAIAATNASLQGSGATYTLSTADNIGTLAANVGTGTVTLNNGSHNLVIGTVNSVNGITAGTFNLTDSGTVTQTQAVTVPTVVLSSSSGTFTLTNSSNNVGAISFGTGSGIGTLSLNNGSNNLSLGYLYVSALNLTDTGTVTQSAGISTSNLSLSGIGGIYSLTAGASNTITTLAANVGNAGTLTVEVGGSTAIGTVNGISGVTAGTFNFSAATGTQTQPITATNMWLNYGNFTLTNSSNNIGTLAATGSGNTIIFNNGGNSLAIGTVNGTNGVTATELDLTDTSTVTQSQKIATTNLSLSGAGGSYTLNNTSNSVTTLAGSVGTGTVNVNDGANTLAIGTVNSINGVTAGEFDVTDTGTVTQTQAIAATNASLQGSGATYTLSTADNIGTLAANVGTGTVTLNNGAHNLSIGTVNSVSGITAGEFDLTDNATVTQSQAIAATNLSLSGNASSTFTFNNSSNAISTLAGSIAYSGSTVSLNDGGNNLLIGTVNGISGFNAGTLNLTDTGTVTQSNGINLQNLSLQGSGGIYKFTSINFAGTLAASVGTGTVDIYEGTGNIGTVNGINGVTAGTFGLYLGNNISMTQTQPITVTNLALSGCCGTNTFTFTNSNNNIGTLAASGGSGTSTIYLNNGSNSLAIGTVLGEPGSNINGVTATELDLTDTSTVTQSQKIATTNLSLSGAGGSYTLNNTSNSVTTLAGSTGTVSFTDSHALTTNTVNSINGLTTTGAITITDNSITPTATTGLISASGQVVTFQPATTTNSMSLAGAGALNISQASLNDITAGTFVLGNTSDTGAITVGAAVTVPASISNLDLITNATSPGITIASGNSFTGSGHRRSFRSKRRQPDRHHLHRRWHRLTHD